MKFNKTQTSTMNRKWSSSANAMRKPILSKTACVIASLLFSTATFQSALANVNLASTPIFLKESVDPNLMFIFDDSGSMERDYMPDSISYGDDLDQNNDGPLSYRRNGNTVSGEAEYVWYFSSRVNTVYYDPNTEYLAPFKPDGTGRFGDSSFSSAWTNGYTQSGSLDLNDRFDTSDTSFRNGGFYYRFNSTEDCEADPFENNCYTLVFLTNESAEQQQNFANWYSYYRTRVFASRAGISEAFYDLPANIRLGYGAIQSDDNDIDGVDTDTIVSGVRTYTPGHREQFLSWLQSKSVGGGTPLRTALQDTGEYYSRDDNRGPWGNQPGTNDSSPHVECRQSYAILMTDGIWNGNNPDVGDTDSTSGPSHTGPDGANFSYSAESPFSDTDDNTLADVAMKYWKEDLRTDLANRVPTAGIDVAFWQHMTTFTVGLGVEGSISEVDAFAAIGSGAEINWPDVSSDSGSPNIDDLLHAAVNGRGGFASAQNPADFSQQIGSFLDTVVARAQTSASAAAVSSAVLRTESLGFFAGFRSEDWSGTLSGFNFDQGQEVWNGEAVLEDTVPSTRNILTHTGSTAVALNDITDLSQAQQDALNADPENPGDSDNLGANRIDWIRGEANAHSSFRNRDFNKEDGTTVRRLLGDIINADPLFVGNSNYGFSRLPGQEGSSYGPYRSTSDYQNRTDALYVAANDGLLHAFDSENGNELFAYMPGELLRPAANSSHAQISSLMSANYTHRYFVDGSPQALDAYIDVDGTTEWRTILVGSMGVGGRSVFALDVTDPSSVTTDNILWEFSHPDLGHGTSEVQIARLPTGDWAAIFGNGYNGSDEEASLFVVKLSDGTLLKQIETGEGGAASSNGLGTPVITTFPETDAITRYAYAGDIQGNLWRFDLTGNNTNGWSAAKLFEAEDPDGVPQPITASPRVTLNPSNLDELIVVFGTGSFIRNGDDSLDQVQSLYAITDDTNKSQLTRSDLVEQTITDQQAVQVARADGSGDNDFVVRETSSNPLTTEDGWYLDLIYNSQKTGERVISSANFPFGLMPDRVRFSTVISDDDPCGSGRTGFIMDLQIESGKPSIDPVFDLDGDGMFNTGDIVAGYPPSGITRGEGDPIRTITDGEVEIIVDDPRKIDKDNPCKDNLCTKPLENSLGRQTWEQLR